jgi:integrase
MIALQNGCSCSEPKVFPENWKSKTASISIAWYIHYRFYDPAVKDTKGKIKPKLVIIKRMNRYTDLLQRQAATQFLLDETLHYLKELSYNPILKQVTAIDQIQDISTDTPFCEAMQFAIDKLDVVKETKQDAESVWRYVKPVAELLRYDEIPIGEIKAKHIAFIFNTLAKQQGSKFTNAKHNRYRANLMMIFKVLIKVFHIIEHNPATAIEPKKKVNKIRVTLTEKERKKVDEHLEEHNPAFHRFMHIFFHSGGREIELMRLQGKDVDLKNQKYKAYVKKGVEEREVIRTIKDIALPYWQDAMRGCKPEDFVFSKGLKPGKAMINSKQLSRRWKTWVKNKLGIDADLYSLKHLNSTEIVDLLSVEDAAHLNSHTSTDMVAKIYDIKRYDRKHERLKQVGNKFS